MVTESKLRIGKRADGQHVVKHARDFGTRALSTSDCTTVPATSNTSTSWQQFDRGSPPAVTLMDGLRSAAIGFAAHRSIDSGLPVLMSELL